MLLGICRSSLISELVMRKTALSIVSQGLTKERKPFNKQEQRELSTENWLYQSWKSRETR